MPLIWNVRRRNQPYIPSVNEVKHSNVMTNLLRALVLLLAAAGSHSSAIAQPPRADHPLIGAWKITLPDGSCSETYIVHKDGTSLVTSAEEVAESEFELSDEPSERGFYKWVDKIVKDNGKKDCSGEVMILGHVATNYILLHPSKDKFLMCEAEDIKTCIGPFVRIRGGDA